MNRNLPDTPPSGASGAPPTILVIEDDASVRDLFTRALQFAGLEVVEAWSGDMALRLIRAGLTPDAVLLDLSMTGMSGWNFLLELSREPTHRAIPVAIVTGHLIIPEDARAMAVELGVAIHHKPVTLENLVKITSGLLQRRAG